MGLLTGGAGLIIAGELAATAGSITSAVLGTALNVGSFGDSFTAGVKGAISGGATAMATAGTGMVGDFNEIRG